MQFTGTLQQTKGREQSIEFKASSVEILGTSEAEVSSSARWLDLALILSLRAIQYLTRNKEFLQFYFDIMLISDLELLR